VTPVWLSVRNPVSPKPVNVSSSANVSGIFLDFGIGVVGIIGVIRFFRAHLSKSNIN
jgi:hypothetical protein